MGLPLRLSGDRDNGVGALLGDRRDNLRVAFGRFLGRANGGRDQLWSVVVEVPEPLLRQSWIWIHRPHI